MTYQTKDWFNDALYIANAVEGAPKYFTYNGLDGNGDTQILLGPTPDGVYSIRVDLVKRQADLTANTIPALFLLNLSFTWQWRYLRVSVARRAAHQLPNTSRLLTSIYDAIAIDAAKHQKRWYLGRFDGSTTAKHQSCSSSLQGC